jgi:hypothetical protein
MGTSVLTKTIQSEIAAIQQLAANAHYESAEVDVSTLWAAQLFIDFARGSSSALTAGVRFKVQVNEKASGDDAWRTVCEFQTDIVAPSSIVTDGIEAIGQDVIECGATVPALNDIVFFLHGTVGLSEWHLVVGRVTTGGSETFTIEDVLTSAQPQQTMYNKAEQYTPLIPLDGAKRMRVIVIGNDQATYFRIGYISLDAVTTS